MRKRGVVWMLLALLLTAVWSAPVGAQATWSALMYESDIGVLTRVDTNGLVDSYQLPVPGGYDVLPFNVAVSGDGTKVAYIVTNSADFSQLLLVYNTNTRDVPAFFQFASFVDGISLNPFPNIFNETSTALAFGYSRNTSDPSVQNPGWELIVLDVTTGNVTSQLTAESPTAVNAGLSAGFGMTPVVQRFANGEVNFSMVQGGTEGAPEYPNYVWNTLLLSVSEAVRYPTIDTDTLTSTGEIITPLVDDRLPNNSAAFIFWQANALHVYDPLVGGRYPFYNNPDFSLGTPRFVGNGGLILTVGYGANGEQAWFLIQRDGSVVSTLSLNISSAGVQGVDDGFLYTLDGQNDTALFHVNTNTLNNLQSREIWRSTGATARLVWVSAPFTAQAVAGGWAQLADPEFANNSIGQGGGSELVSPQQVPTPPFAVSPTLQLNSAAIVNTTGGDVLNMRSAAGTNYDVVARLESGTRVTILEGPRAANSYTWWRVETADGLSGWVVESVVGDDGVINTLIPAQ